MTGAQRQRKHREKLKRELQELRAIVPPQHNETELLYQLQSLRAQLAKAERERQQAHERIKALEVTDLGTQALRHAVAGMLRALTPSARTAATAHLKAAGVLDALPPEQAPQAPPRQAVTPASFFSL